jgi:hypothetical protein
MRDNRIMLSLLANESLHHRMGLNNEEKEEKRPLQKYNRRN